MLQISRRSFMQMAAASTVVAGASAGSSRASTQSAGTGNLIDTHHHIFPPGLQDWLRRPSTGSLDMAKLGSMEPG